jgi:t-SNARE complex subunit (syntaxin)
MISIDHIESNIDESVSRVEDGVVELRKANEYQKSSRNKMCCLALILLIVAGVTVLVVYFVLAK